MDFTVRLNVIPPILTLIRSWVSNWHYCDFRNVQLPERWLKQFYFFGDLYLFLENYTFLSLLFLWTSPETSNKKSHVKVPAVSNWHCNLKLEYLALALTDLDGFGFVGFVWKCRKYVFKASTRSVHSCGRNPGPKERTPGKTCVRNIVPVQLHFTLKISGLMNSIAIEQYYDMDQMNLDVGSNQTRGQRKCKKRVPKRHFLKSCF